jgi:hypothetical protein
MKRLEGDSYQMRNLANSGPPLTREGHVKFEL